MIPIFVLFFVLDEVVPYNRLYALVVFVLASATDLLDGWIARKYNLVTDLGKFLDPIADKLLVNSAIILFVYDTYQYSSELVGLFMLLTAIVFVSREMIISAFRLIAVTKGVVLAADIWGKLKTIAQMLGTMIVILASCVSLDASEGVLYIGIVVLGLAGLLSILSCANYMIANKGVIS
jgi:CDP-diacylglycerol--glycerol-3-phosphate 3-phosphatidyltransferase